MQIVAPVSRHEEIELLAAAGADEFYCGVVPKGWVDRFGTSGVNRRLFANLPDMGAMARVVETAHALGKSVSLTLNAQQYTEEMTGAIVDLAGRYGELGGDAVIVSDPEASGPPNTGLSRTTLRERLQQDADRLAAEDRSAELRDVRVELEGTAPPLTIYRFEVSHGERRVAAGQISTYITEQPS